MSDESNAENLMDQMMATDHFHFACIYMLILDVMDRQGDKEKEWVEKFLNRVSRLIDAHEQKIGGMTDGYLNVKVHELMRQQLDTLTRLLRSD
jgi:hypothetical protein